MRSTGVEGVGAWGGAKGAPQVLKSLGPGAYSRNGRGCQMANTTRHAPRAGPALGAGRVLPLPLDFRDQGWTRLPGSVASRTVINSVHTDGGAPAPSGVRLKAPGHSIKL